MNRTLPFRWIPEGAQEIAHPEGLGVCYKKVREDGRIVIVAYRGKSNKPAFNYYYLKMEQADDKVQAFFAGLSEWEKRKAERRAERNQPHSLKVGDILHYSWGYDQTNNDFFQVTAVSACTVKMREIQQEVVNLPGYSDMSDHRIAKKDAFVENAPTLTKRARGSMVSMAYGCASLWDGRPAYNSWYA